MSATTQIVRASIDSVPLTSDGPQERDHDGLGVGAQGPAAQLAGCTVSRAQTRAAVGTRTLVRWQANADSAEVATRRHGENEQRVVVALRRR